MNPSNKNKFILLFLLVIFVGIRLINISSEEFWYDEYYNLLIAKNLSFSNILYYVKHVFHPPLYYWTIKPWLIAFGLNELSGRSFSILFSLIFFFYYQKTIHLITKNKSTLLYGLLFLIFSSFNVEYSQEARQYTFQLGLFSIFLYHSLKFFFTKYHKTSDAILIIVTSSASLITHYNHVVVFITLFIMCLVTYIFLSSSRQKIRIYLIFLLTSLIIVLPYYFTVLTNYQTNIGLGFLMKSPKIPFLLLSTTLIYFYFIKINLFYLILSTFLIILIFPIVNNNFSWKKRPEIIFLIGFVIIYLILFSLSPLSRSYTFSWQRHLILTEYVFLLIIPVLINECRRNKIIKNSYLLVFFLCNSISLPLVLKNDSLWFYNHQHSIISNYIENHEIEGDIILIPKTTFDMMIKRYYQGNNNVLSLVSDNSYYDLPTKSALDITFNPDWQSKKIPFTDNLNKIINEGNRVWIVNNYSSEDKFAIEFLNKTNDWKKISIEKFENDRLLLFEKTSE